MIEIKQRIGDGIKLLTERLINLYTTQNACIWNVEPNLISKIEGLILNIAKLFFSNVDTFIQCNIYRFNSFIYLVQQRLDSFKNGHF